MGKCRLCNEEAKLQMSHIIPRSLIKDVKDGDSQLHVFSYTSAPTYSNADPKELLLCKCCEQYISSNYEQYGTQLIKRPKNIIKHNDRIEFKEFDYKKWYLYYLSIIWRASISSLQEFVDIQLGGFNDILKECIKNDTLTLTEDISIDECIVISMFRVVDRSGRLDDKAIKNIMLNLTGVKEGDDSLFFFMANGFLIQYQITPNYIFEKKNSGCNKTIVNRNARKCVKMVDITESRLLCENFNWLVDNV
ncbi:hypothetical protein [Photobacterium phosphoreum]|uniref:hypothetical protein n=1 Tax=Photobacterium phosphoreum TaxID=659 RepID=UPI001E3BD753|nr:hypothetical protein [Photobacterium phosphoreum]MCD9505793.1 hypothetical protein [Photobacterium phosphoreum]